MAKTPTLEERIASTLGEGDAITSSAIASLIAEVETAAADADVAAKQAHEAALDPAVVVDAAKVGAAVATAALTRDRLQAAVPRLQARSQEVAMTESLAAWRVDFDAVEIERDAVADELCEVYQACVAKLVDLMERIAEVDRKVDYVNGHAPPGAQARLYRVEEKVRGSGPSLAATLKLPKFTGTDMAWPPYVPSLAQQVAREMMANPRAFNPPGPGLDWHKEIEERNARIVEDNRRQVAEAEARLREREQREHAEAVKAKGADRAAYAAHGWPV